MLAAQRKSAGLDLEAVEMATRAGLHRAGAAILTPLLAEPGDPAPRTACACGAQARYHDQRPKRLLTALGPVQLERAYCVCPHCQQGQSPRDRELDVEGTECSPGVRRMMALVGAETSFDKGREQLDLLAGIEVAAKAVARHAEAIGADTPRPGRGSSPTTGRSSSPRISRSSFGSQVRRTSGLRRSTRNRTGKSSAGTNP